MKQVHHQKKLTLADTELNAKLEALLHQHKLKVTAIRLLILKTLLEQDGYLTVDSLLKAIWHRYSDQKVSLSGVYGSIKKLVDAGVVQRCFIDGKYTYNYSGSCVPTDQLVEIASGRVFDLSHALLQQAKVQIAKEYGFNAENCRIELHAYPGDTDGVPLDKPLTS